MIKNKIFQIIIIFSFCFFLSSCLGIKSLQKDLENKNVIEKNLEFRENFTKQGENKFSIAVIPDVQCYTHILAQNFDYNHKELKYGYIFYRQTKFIAEHSVKNGGDFSVAIQVGDLVHQKGNLTSEWQIASLCMENLIDEIPFLVVPGNHDYDRWIKHTSMVDGSDTYNYYFGPESKFFKEKEWYRGSSANGRNSWITFEACGYTFLVIGLEILPSDESLDWAQSVIDAHKNLPTIYVTHEFISAGERDVDAPLRNEKFTSTTTRKEFPHNSPQEVWRKFISKNNQIFMILCGHISNRKTGSGLRIDKNSNRNTVYTILSDYQSAKNYLPKNGFKPLFYQPCGDGWMTILDFDLDSKNIFVHTYSTEFDEFRTDNYAELTLPIDWNWEERFSKK